MVITTEQKKKYIPYLVMFVMIAIIVLFTVMWNNERNERIRLQNNINVATVVEGIEQPGQEEIQNRNNLNESIDKQIAAGNTRLGALYNIEKDVRNRRAKNVSTKDDITSISRDLAAMGIANTIVSGGDYTTVKVFTNNSTQTSRGTKVNK